MNNLGKRLWNAIAAGGVILGYDAFRVRMEQNKKYAINQEKLNEVCENLNEAKNLSKEILEFLQKQAEIIENKKSSHEEVRDATGKIIDKIVDISKDDKNKLLDLNFNELIENFKEFLSILSIEQLCMVINIFTTLFILSCVFSIFSSYFGNYIIDKLELESKFPKISKFIKIRVKFQHYYILINLLIITLSLFFLIYINYLTLIS